jgi:hypothetical protein
MVHVDLKKLRKIPAGGGYAFLGRAEGGRNSHADKTGVLNAHYNPVRGYGYVHAAVNDHSRLAYAEVLGDERAETAAAFWRRASAWFAGYGITIDRVLTDNGNCYRSHLRRHTLHDTGGETEVHPAPTSPDQRQGRAVQPHPARGVGLREAVPHRVQLASRPCRGGCTLQPPPVWMTPPTPARLTDIGSLARGRSCRGVSWRTSSRPTSTCSATVST